MRPHRAVEAALLALAVAVVGWLSPVAAVEPGRQAWLVNLVRQDCGSCHGMTLKGGLGRALLPERLADVPSEGLAAIILDGVPGTPMPPWRGQISEEEAMWIADQLKAGFPQ